VEAAVERPKPETIEFVYDATMDARARQLRAAEAHDSKAVQVFAAATLVIGLGAAGSLHGTAPAAIIGVALAGYVVAAWAALSCLRVRRFSVEPSPAYLWRRYWSSDVLTMQHALIADRGKGYAKNAERLREKTRWLRYAVVATGVETVLVGTALLVSLTS
jgi:hypothetical protein